MRTWLTILPLESHCHAARIGFVNPFSGAMPILAASLFPSGSYNPVEGAQIAGTSRGLPTGGAPGVFVSFDHTGLDAPAVTGGGQVRHLIIPGDPSNPENSQRPFTIIWSDWIPLRSIPRIDGGGQPLLFIYTAMDRGDMATAGLGDPFRYAAGRGGRGRATVSLRSDRPGDWTGKPDGTTWSGSIGAPVGPGSQWGFSPVFCLQYLSAIPGVQGVISGDSLMSGPTGEHGDCFSAAPLRAAYDLSQPSRPVCIAHLGCGGAPSAIYNETLLRNLTALRPSFLVLQPLSRNDGMATAQLDELFARLLITSDLAAARYGAQTIFQGAYPIPTVDPSLGGNSAQVACWQNVRSVLRSMAEAGVPIYDGASTIGLEGAPWLFRPGYSDDGIHPNNAATEALTPAVRTLLAQQIGF